MDCHWSSIFLLFSFERAGEYAQHPIPNAPCHFALSFRELLWWSKAQNKGRGDAGTMAKCSCLEGSLSKISRRASMHQNLISWEPITSGQCSSGRGESPIQKGLGFDPWSPEEHRILSIPLKAASFVSDMDANGRPPREPPESFGPAGPCRLFVSLGWFMELTWILRYNDCAICYSRWRYKHTTNSIIMTMPLPCEIYPYIWMARHKLLRYLDGNAWHLPCKSFSSAQGEDNIYYITFNFIALYTCHTWSKKEQSLRVRKSEDS